MILAEGLLVFSTFSTNIAIFILAFAYRDIAKDISNLKVLRKNIIRSRINMIEMLYNLTNYLTAKE